MPDEVRSSRGLARRIYPHRIMGMGLGGIPMATVLYQQQAPLAAWCFLGFAALVWPHLAFVLAVRSSDPHRTETHNLLVDSALAGALVSLMHFNLLPSALVMTLTTLDKVSTGMRGLWLRSIPWMLLGIMAMALLTGTGFAPHTDMAVIIACLPVLVIHTVAVSLGSYRLIRKVGLQNLELDRLRRIDTLTGLAARAHWEEHAERLLRDRATSGLPACLLLLDIDNFKQVNDQHGHAAGDEVLRAIASKIRISLRPHDLPGRIGGDEMVVLLPDSTLEQAWVVADRVRRAVAEIRLRDFPQVHPTVSIGLAAAGEGGAESTLRTWFNAADGALYRAKAAGRNQVMD